MTDEAITPVSNEIVVVEDNSLTELDLLAYGVENVGDTLNNLINLITVDKVSERGTSKITVSLLLSALHGMNLQVQEIYKKMREPHADFSRTGPGTDVEKSLRVSLAGAEERADELTNMVQSQQDRIRELESDERRSGVWEKLKQQEATIDSQKARISYFEEFEKKIKSEKKRSRKRRRDLATVKRLAAESAAQKINRAHEECEACAHRKTSPPVCTGHAQGDTVCHLFVPKDLPKE